MSTVERDGRERVIQWYVYCSDGLRYFISIALFAICFFAFLIFAALSLAGDH